MLGVLKALNVFYIAKDKYHELQMYNLYTWLDS